MDTLLFTRKIFARSLVLLLASLMVLPEIPEAEARRGRPHRPARRRVCDGGQSPYGTQSPQGNVSVKPAPPRRPGVDMRVDPNLVRDAGTIASALNRHVVITDGFRSLCRNRGTRGSGRNSKHMYGKALDLRSASPVSEAGRIGGLVGRSLSSVTGGYHNSCRNNKHVHVEEGRSGFTSECGGGRGQYGRRRRGGAYQPRRRRNWRRRAEATMPGQPAQIVAYTTYVSQPR